MTNMALTSFKGSIVRKGDITVAKNYLTADEIDTLNRLVVIFLETAELRVKNRQDITTDFWRENVDRMLDFNDKKILKGYGSITTEIMKEKVREIYTEFDTKRKVDEAKETDIKELEELKELLGESRG